MTEIYGGESKRKKTRGLGLPQQQKKLVTLSDDGKKREKEKSAVVLLSTFHDKNERPN